MFITSLKKIIVFIISHIYPGYFYLLRKHLKGCQSVLEIGCGQTSPLRYFTHKFYSVGLDAHRGSIEKTKEIGIYNDYICADFLRADIKPKSFDCVIALDLIEHLEKQEGLELIRKAENIARKKIIIFTPNGFLKQDEIDGNPWQAHKSGWTVDEMKKLYFNVFGVRGLKFLRKGLAKIKYQPKFFWWPISFLTQLFIYFYPKYAFHIFCVKFINKKCNDKNKD